MLNKDRLFLLLYIGMFSLVKELHVLITKEGLPLLLCNENAPFVVEVKQGLSLLLYDKSAPLVQKRGGALFNSLAHRNAEFFCSFDKNIGGAHGTLRQSSKPSRRSNSVRETTTRKSVEKCVSGVVSPAKTAKVISHPLAAPAILATFGPVSQRHHGFHGCTLRRETFFPATLPGP